MRTDQLSKTVWTKIDDFIKPNLKRTLGLQSNAAYEYLYGESTDGPFGIPLAADDSDIAHINGGFKLLTSKDPILRRTVWDELTETSNYRFISLRI